MPYTTPELVQAATGRLLDDLTKNPSAEEVDGFISRVAKTLNGYLSGAGFDLDDLDQAIVDALEGTATDGVVVLALEARYGSAAGERVAPGLEGARSRWAADLKALARGEHPALVAGQESATGVGGSFFADEAGSYIPAALMRTGAPFNPNTQPDVYEGMKL